MSELIFLVAGLSIFPMLWHWYTRNAGFMCTQCSTIPARNKIRLILLILSNFFLDRDEDSS
jgi:hypothetical protein